MPKDKTSAYQEKNPEADDARGYQSLQCSEPLCPNLWTVNATGIYYKCTRHAWVDRFKLLAGARPWVDPFEGVPAFKEFGMRAWAHRLKFRDDRGDKLTDMQRAKYRAALGLP